MKDLDLEGNILHMVVWKGKGVQGTVIIEMKEEIHTEVIEITEVIRRSPTQSQGVKEMTLVHGKIVLNIV